MNSSILARGSPAEAEHFELHVNLGAALCGPITLEAGLPAVGYEDDHGHEEAP